jgi:hypothetical protein
MAKAIPANAPKGSCTCFKCAGSGLFYAGGAVVNGVYNGKVGTCFGCKGKGYQTPEDKARCAAYWRHNLPRP